MFLRKNKGDILLNKFFGYENEFKYWACVINI